MPTTHSETKGLYVKTAPTFRPINLRDVAGSLVRTIVSLVIISSLVNCLNFVVCHHKEENDCAG